MNTLDTKQAAAFLHIHSITLLRKINSGEIPAAKIGKRWVMIDVDLAQYLRSQYPQQASQGDNKETALCHSTNGKTPRSGGSKSRSQVLSRYNNLLEPPISKKRESTKQGLKIISGNRQD